MKKPLYILALAILFAGTAANADIWKWTDANGDVHYVNTNTPIYTWVDDYGMVQFADTPRHDDVDEAAQQEADGQSGSVWAHPGETPEERLEREKAEAYYCKRAKDIYESYLGAPRLYETNEEGEKVYLTDEQAAAKIKETEAAVAQVCR